MRDAVLGWDLGGAHLKAARVEDGRVMDALQIPCRLWQGLEHLDATMNKALSRLGPARRHAVTMTGEMADIFPSREEGVCALTAAAKSKLGDISIFAGDAGFVSPDEALKQWRHIASANWIATALMAAKKLPQAVLVDIGSTTTDIVPVADGKLLARGRSDSERLASNELVYSGIVRTPVMALASTVDFEGQTQGVMAELFATMADAYRVAGLLPKGADDFPAADNGGKAPQDSARRLARMLGRDVESASFSAWQRFAGTLVGIQTAQIADALMRVIDRASLDSQAPLVGAGCGRFLVEGIARRLERGYIDFADLVPVDAAAHHSAAICAPAVAVAVLAAGI
jgi:(4-(4-[2-(gamma-L-glutamylamino)ethyl]phenoxymethyl)furan-2-yl)methanamine synthase